MLERVLVSYNYGHLLHGAADWPLPASSPLVRYAKYRQVIRTPGRAIPDPNWVQAATESVLIPENREQITPTMKSITFTVQIQADFNERGLSKQSKARKLFHTINEILAAHDGTTGGAQIISPPRAIEVNTTKES